MNIKTEYEKEMIKAFELFPKKNINGTYTLPGHMTDKEFTKIKQNIDDYSVVKASCRLKNSKIIQDFDKLIQEIELYKKERKMEEGS